MSPDSASGSCSGWSQRRCGAARYALWAAGFLVEVATPALAGARLRRGPAINCSHLPERFGLFVIIVPASPSPLLGWGFRTSREHDTHRGACFVLAAALWWDCFVFGYWSARRGLLSSARRGAYARDVYGYAHFPVVVGIAAASVGAERAIAHSGDAGLARSALGAGRWAGPLPARARGDAPGNGARRR